MPPRSKSPGTTPKGKSRAKSPKEGKKSPKSPKSPPSAKKPGKEEPDVLDTFIDAVSVAGVFAIMAALIGIGIQIWGQPESFGLHICSLVLGMGRGGVPRRDGNRRFTNVAIRLAYTVLSWERRSVYTFIKCFEHVGGRREFGRSVIDMF